MFTVFVKDPINPRRQELFCIFLLGVSLFFLTGGSFWWYGRHTEDSVYLASQRTGRGLVDLIILRQHYQKLSTDQAMKTLETFLGPELGNQEYSWSLIKPRADGTDQPRDEFEWDVLKRFQQPNPPPFVERRQPARTEYDYYQSVRAKQGGCMACHNTLQAGLGQPELKNGDLMAIVKVVLPDGENIDDVRRNRATLISTAILTVFLAIAVSYLIVHYVIVKPLRHGGSLSDT